MASPLLLLHPPTRPGSLRGRDRWMWWTPVRTATVRTAWSSTLKPTMGFTPRTAMGMGHSPTATPWPPWPWTSLIIRYADATVESVEAFGFYCDNHVTREGAIHRNCAGSQRHGVSVIAFSVRCRGKCWLVEDRAWFGIIFFVDFFDLPFIL